MAFAEDWQDAILTRIAEGESLRTICKDEKLPGLSFVFKRLANDPDFADQYARAREVQADTFFDDALDIADNATPETVQHARLRVDTRKWMAGKLRPKVYGERVQVGGDRENPVVHEHGANSALEHILGKLDAITERSGTPGSTPEG